MHGKVLTQLFQLLQLLKELTHKQNRLLFGLIKMVYINLTILHIEILLGEQVVCSSILSVKFIF